MKKNLQKATGMLLLMMVVGSAWGQTTYTSTATGNWSTMSWDPAGMPLSTDNIVIADGHTVTIDQNISIASLTVGQGVSGTLMFDGTTRIVTITGNVSVLTGATFITQAATTVTHSMNLGGNLSNNGIFDMSQGGTTFLCDVTFSKDGNQTISGTGSTTRFNNIILNMGTSNTNILEVTAINFSAKSAFLTITNGTFKLTSAVVVNTFSGVVSFPTTGGIWVNGGTITTTGASLIVNGKLQIDSGTLNVGSSTGHRLDINGSSAQFIMNGGTLNISGYWDQTSSGDANITAGVINILTAGSVSNSVDIVNIPSTCDFIMSGGSFNVKNLNSGLGREFYILQGGNTTITGGTINIENSVNISGTAKMRIENLNLNNFNIDIGNTAVLENNEKNLTVNNNMTVSSGTFQINAALYLTVTGTLTNNAGTSGLVIQSDATGTGSLTHNTTGVFGTMQRYIPAYTTSADGWHLLSSPVNNMAIAGSDFEPGASSPNLDDFYAFSESNYEWLNYKVGANNIINFVNGTGYLVSYETTATKDFTGTLNAADVPFTNLSKTAGQGNGWHLLGNPFQSALQWTDTDWARTNIAPGAKIMNSGGTYTDITVGGTDIIPANQGFFVQATADANNSITIPISQRVHDATLFYKSSILNQLALKVSDGEFYVETWIQMMEGATADFDDQYDVNFLGGMYQAPYLYSIIPEEGHLSTNRIALVNEQTTVPLAFKAFLNREYTIISSNASSFGDEIEVILEDTQENIQIDLKDTLAYTFMATADELTERFVVHFFNVTGISETTHPESVQIYSYGNRIYLRSELNAYGNVSVYNMLAQKVYNSPVDLNGLQSFNLNLNIGWYVVQVVTEQGVKSKKVFIN